MKECNSKMSNFTIFHFSYLEWKAWVQDCRDLVLMHIQYYSYKFPPLISSEDVFLSK